MSSDLDPDVVFSDDIEDPDVVFSDDNEDPDVVFSDDDSDLDPDVVFAEDSYSYLILPIHVPAPTTPIVSCAITVKASTVIALGGQIHQNKFIGWRRKKRLMTVALIPLVSTLVWPNPLHFNASDVDEGAIVEDSYSD